MVGRQSSSRPEGFCIMLVLPELELLSRVCFMLLVGNRMMVRAEENEIVERVRLFFGERRVRARTAWCESMNVRYSDLEGHLRLRRGRLDKHVRAIGMCALVAT